MVSLNVMLRGHNTVQLNSPHLLVIGLCDFHNCIAPIHATDAKEEQVEVQILHRYLTPGRALQTDKQDARNIVKQL